MQKSATKITNGHFIKVCNAFGVRLFFDGQSFYRNGEFLTKKYGIYGRDEKGIFYCDVFPKKYNGKTPSLKIWRPIWHDREWGTGNVGYKWECHEEKSSTSERIWHLYNKFGCKKPQALKDQDFKRNNKITQFNVTYGKRFSATGKPNSQKVWNGDKGDFCNWNEENAGIIETVKKGEV